ncbi:hypothetical protein [uncultured Ruegeria sp.]|uniref:hypothetical protein n=1 Tax=uncultured Ruegeria sp. TaxID=259304 RepID=UPI002614DC59|nr:hypothetical protein [uncultured Ruegeria sp.]
MEQPTVQWQRARIAALEGAHRRILEPVGRALFNGTATATLCFLVVFVWHNLFTFRGIGNSLIIEIQHLIAASSMLTMLLLTVIACPVALIDWRYRREIEYGSNRS